MDADIRRALLDVAREAVAAAATGAAPPQPSEEIGGMPELNEPRGAFVTLHGRGGELRGCIGTTQASVPLIEVVVDMARAAALRDPRFPPVRPEEVEDLDLEVSVLFPLEPITSPSEVEIGTHGMVVEGHGRRGLLLPQVAAERDWTPEIFAEHTCLKAGLPAEAWRDPEVRLYRFRSEVFGEHDAAPS